MVSIKTPHRRDEVPASAASMRYAGDRRAKTRGAAKKAQHIAAWVAAQRVSSPQLGREGPDEHALFAALQTCAYHVTRRVCGKPVRPTERDLWSGRWRLIRDHAVDRNLGLAYKMLTGFQTSRADWDELHGEALFALVRAVEGFNPWRGARFSTYACQAIARALVQASRKASRHGLQVVAEPESGREHVSKTDRWSELYLDRLRVALHENRGQLTERESMILARRFPADGGSVRTLSQVAGFLGLSKERVRQIQNVALTKLRLVLEADPVLQ